MNGDYEWPSSPEARFEKAIQDEWHALRVTLQKRPYVDAPTEMYRIMCAQQVILESIYYLRTGRLLKP